MVCYAATKKDLELLHCSLLKDAGRWLVPHHSGLGQSSLEEGHVFAVPLSGDGAAALTHLYLYKGGCW